MRRAVVAITTSDQSPHFNTVLALLLLANDQASINAFNADLTHYWGRNWSSESQRSSDTFWATGNNGNNGNNNTSYGQGVSTDTEYHFSVASLWAGAIDIYDFRFSASGVPGQQAHWPFVRVTWQPTKTLYLSGIVGVVISHTQGNSGEKVNPGGIGQLEYNFSSADS